LASPVQELPRGQISGLGKHGLLFLEHSCRIKLIHAKHELLFAFEIEVGCAAGQASGIGNIRHSAIGQPSVAKRSYCRIHEFGLHTEIITLLCHAQKIAVSRVE
jgi:hypothetical protein